MFVNALRIRKLRSFLLSFFLVSDLSLSLSTRAATTGSIELTGTVTEVLDLTVDQTSYSTAFTNSQLLDGMGGGYQDVAKLLIDANNYYIVTLDNLFFSSSEIGAENIPIIPKLSPKGGSAATGSTQGSSVVFTINDQNDGTSGNGDVISITTPGDSDAPGGSWSATISVTLAAQ